MEENKQTGETEEKKVSEEANSKTEKVRALFDLYKEGKIKKDEYVVFICEALKSYIIHLAKQYGRETEMEDVIQLGFEAIIRAVDKYDPYRTALTTFFKTRIIEGTKKDDRVEIKKHYKDMENKLNKAAKEYGFESMYDNRLKITTLATISGISLTTIEQVIQQNRCKISIEGTEGEKWINQKNPTPEDVFLESEIKSLCDKAKENLSPLEKWLINIFIENPRNPKLDFPKYFDAEKDKIDKRGKPQPPSFRSIALIFNDEKIPEFRQMFADELPDIVTVAFIENTLYKAKNKIRNNTVLRKYTNYKGEDIVLFEDVDEEESVMAALEELLI